MEINEKHPDNVLFITFRFALLQEFVETVKYDNQSDLES